MAKNKIEESSGNVFGDLGFPEADEFRTKAQLAHRIGEIIRGRHLTQAEAAEVLDATQPIVSRLMRGQLHGFSLARLVRFLNTLGRDVEIVVRRRHRSRDRGETRVKVAG